MNEEASRPEPETAALLMAGIGGMLAFFGLSFGLVAAVVGHGFLVVCLVTCAIAVSLLVLAYVSRKRQLGEWQRAEQAARAAARCEYCGTQNRKGAVECESCGARL